VLQLATGAVTLALAPPSAAEAGMVPAVTQASLLAKVASYDRNFAARAIDRAKLLLIQRSGDPESSRVVREMQDALTALPAVGALPHEEEVENFVDGPTVATICTSHRISVVYIGPGLGREIPAIRAALSSLDILSVAADPDYVPQGIVLGFRLVAGEARILLHRGQAKAQNVNFGARILRRMTIFDDRS